MYLLEILCAKETKMRNLIYGFIIYANVRPILVDQCGTNNNYGDASAAGGGKGRRGSGSIEAEARSH